MNDQTFSIAAAIKLGWQKTVANLGSFFVILIVTWGASAITSSIAKSRNGGHGPVASLISFLGWILLVLLQMGFFRSVLKVLDDGKPALADFYSTVMEFLSFVVAGFMCGVAVVVGLILLVVPGVILAVRLQFYPYFVLERKLGPLGALKASWEATRGHAAYLTLFLLAYIAIIAVGALLLGVGLFIAVPVVTIAAASVYRKLSTAMPAAPAVSATTSTP